MKAFTCHTGVAAPLLRRNIDTDAIIPSREMKRVSKLGLGEGLFAGWRYTIPGGREANPEFILNQPGYANTSILLSRENFGCGSSREHAVWALVEFGIRAIVAESFGAIFHTNCIRNGVLPVVLPAAAIAWLADFVQADPQRHRLTVDLEHMRVRCEGVVTEEFDFSLDAGAREMLLKGLDPIAQTLLENEAIARFEQARAKEHPWAFRLNGTAVE
ncbi:3-isopropylmalate dehydratase small subunit [Microbulbifer sp. ALW1]|uniref:3-isopropylmalate dehydratase small subunit n=1 Tax=Microbulbifer sp. (strain ALW1) TaxID=1516059 RepID=UPI00135CA10A|nr:3-isopropylmalate dehydratase small subunit [Microbulbifer sp. ALW1]